eukprot:CAMPEP_0171234602 /NCGR_PEP_ID=MMETSP0790-20130122/41516_1 /TAXON_ID=2925 /ORGANISM="Alexandrium catenella, Strain OF101" /LENGTH=259 /DNA_ID=CAMNT_0011700889 /DNA_START=57 /DNA_END=836 /DNA_ORIENTATION=-
MVRTAKAALASALLLWQGMLGDEACEADEAGLLQSKAARVGARAGGAPAVLETPRLIADLFQTHLKEALDKAIQQNEKDGYGWSPKSTRKHAPAPSPPPAASAFGTAAVTWNFSNLEQGDAVRMIWDHGCDSEGKLTGKCVFPKQDHNPSRMHVKVAKPVDDKARIKTSLEVKAFLINFKMSADCALCGPKCIIQLPAGAPSVMTLPPCPLPEHEFDVNMSAVDLSFMPSFMHGAITSHTSFVRGTGSPIMNLDMGIAM